MPATDLPGQSGTGAASDNREAATLPFRWVSYAVIGLAAVLLVAIRFAGPSNLIDNNELRMGPYVLDAVRNGNWISQHDVDGRCATKPPMVMWIAASASAVCGRVTRFTLYLPAALAALVVGWITLSAGRQRFGWLAGLWAGLAWVVSPLGAQEAMMARYDGVFAVGVTAGALAAFYAWQTGRGWTWFWLACAAATLTKGPLGVLLAGAGLLAVVWEWRSGHPLALRGSHGPGVVLFLAITAGWLYLAWRQDGAELLRTLFFREMLGQAVGASYEVPWSDCYRPLLAFLGEWAPWGWLAALGLWRVWKRPAADPQERRFERFLFCWLLFGLVLFTVATHARDRLILPLLPAAALLAGRELARLSPARPAAAWKLVVVVAVVGLGAVALYYARFPGKRDSIAMTRGMEELAATVRRQVGEEFPLTHVDDPFPLQFYLNTVRPVVTYEQAAALLRGKTPAFVAVRDFTRLHREVGPDAPLYDLARWPEDGEAAVRIVGNHPRLEWTSRQATCVGPLRLEMDGVRWRRQKRGELVLTAGPAGGTVTVANNSPERQTVSVRIETPHGRAVAQRADLVTGEILRVTALSSSR